MGIFFPEEEKLMVKEAKSHDDKCIFLIHKKKSMEKHFVDVLKTNNLELNWIIDTDTIPSPSLNVSFLLTCTHIEAIHLLKLGKQGFNKIQRKWNETFYKELTNHLESIKSIDINFSNISMFFYKECLEFISTNIKTTECDAINSYYLLKLHNEKKKEDRTNNNALNDIKKYNSVHRSLLDSDLSISSFPSSVSFQRSSQIPGILCDYLQDVLYKF